ncbi:unnamed protein product [Didymodactylos carnosus]|uniref:Tetratricopeptide repeat protein n=1 Tax=Didymodactylos carnosus TaxID=1234261 RepID=A0A814XDD4_9BILA|nr:unnamed protein product [Didymodactylos carnosus]CAF1213462.1 unnamed protein product [Didymodactylos carnosus]CAF3977397.1 unnamed protein product [Didymodactylos carnosus]CAF3986303.1 unnamed protein product [Didymodactylos carnosus]
MKQDKGAIFSEVGRQKNTTDMSGSWWPTFVQLLCNLPYPENSCQSLVSTLKKYYQDNPAELNKLDEFERTYTPETAIWWYTRDAFLYRLLNKALRQHNIETLFLFGFCVRDIYNQLKKEHKKLGHMLDEEPIYRVYRGQMMSLDEIKHLERGANPNNSVRADYIVVNSFFSTANDRSMALLMLDPLIKASDELQNVLFEIELDVRNESRPFANISHLSNFTSENEVLLMAGIELQIVLVVFDDGSKAYIMESKLNEDEIVTMDDSFPDSTEKEVLKNCLDQVLKCHFLVDPEDLDIIFDGLRQIFPSDAGWFEAFKHQCLADYELVSEENAGSTFFHYKKAIEIYKNYLNNRDLNFAANIASIHYSVGSIYASQVYDRQSAANHYDLGIQCVTSSLRKTTKPKHLTELYKIIGDLYRSKPSNLNKKKSNENSLNANKYRQLQLQEMLKCYSPDHIKLADCFYDLAHQQNSNSLFEEAVKRFGKAIEIHYSQRWPRFDVIKSIYKELSEIFITEKKDYTHALYYKQKQLETVEDHLKTDYQKSWKMSQLAECHIELADIYVKLNRLESANENLLVAKTIWENKDDTDKDRKIKEINEKLEYIASLS